MKKQVEVNSRQWAEFAAQVEGHLLSESIVRRGLLDVPRSRPGETAMDAKLAAAAAFLRWLALEQAQGRQLEGPPPRKGGRWDGHWGNGRGARRKATRQVSSGADDPRSGR